MNNFHSTLSEERRIRDTEGFESSSRSFFSVVQLHCKIIFFGSPITLQSKFNHAEIIDQIEPFSVTIWFGFFYDFDELRRKTQIID